MSREIAKDADGVVPIEEVKHFDEISPVERLLGGGRKMRSIDDFLEWA